MAKGHRDNMHLGDVHPFQSKFSNHKQFAKMTGVKAPPGGEGKMQSANAAMKKKSHLQGPGKA